MITPHRSFEAILTSARAYYAECCARDGVPPQTFAVSEDEYRFLQWVDTYEPIGLVGMRLLGMRVVTSECDGTETGQPSDWRRLRALEPLTMAHVEQVLASLLGPPPPRILRLIPQVDSETSSMDEWEAGVHTMIAEVKQRRGPS